MFLIRSVGKSQRLHLVFTAFFLDIGWCSEGSADLYNMSLCFSATLQKLSALLLPGLFGWFICLQNFAMLIMLHLAIRISLAHLLNEVRIDNHFFPFLWRLPAVRAKKTLV